MGGADGGSFGEHSGQLGCRRRLGWAEGLLEGRRDLRGRSGLAWKVAFARSPLVADGFAVFRGRVTGGRAAAWHRLPVSRYRTFYRCAAMSRAVSRELYVRRGASRRACKCFICGASLCIMLVGPKQRSHTLLRFNTLSPLVYMSGSRHGPCGHSQLALGRPHVGPMLLAAAFAFGKVLGPPGLRSLGCTAT